MQCFLGGVLWLVYMLFGVCTWHMESSLGNFLVCVCSSPASIFIVRQMLHLIKHTILCLDQWILTPSYKFHHILGGNKQSKAASHEEVDHHNSESFIGEWSGDDESDTTEDSEAVPPAKQRVESHTHIKKRHVREERAQIPVPPSVSVSLACCQQYQSYKFYQLCSYSLSV